LTSEESSILSEQVEVEEFDEKDVEKEGEEDEPFLGLDDDEVIALLLALVWDGFLLNEALERYRETQFLRFLNNLAAALSGAVPISDTGVVSVATDSQLQREAAKAIIAGVVGTPSNKTQFNAMRIADVIVRSHLQAIASSVARGTAKKNSNIIGGVIWSAILDSRTCMICAALDGTFYPMDVDGVVEMPQMPAHKLCRCIPIFVMSRFVGIEQGGVLMPKSVSFTEWMGNQSESTLVKLMGEGRYRLWKSGKLKFKDFVQFRGKVPVRERTLSALRKMVS